jgi:hypothetical protein
MIFKKLAASKSPQFYRIFVTWLVLIGCTLLLTEPVFAENKQPCDCMDVKFEPSKERIKISKAEEVNQLLQAVEKNNPTEIGLLKKIVATADTFLQRHMNGDMYQDQSPDDWDEYNGPIMNMSMTDWMRTKYEHDNSEWVACPKAQMVALVSAPNRNVIRYEFITVGRFVKIGRTFYDAVFTDAENGSLFSIEVTINDQAKVTGMRQIPQGYSSHPYTWALRFLKKRIKKVSVNDTGEKSTEISADNAMYSKEISAIVQAAKACAAPMKTGK